VLLSTDEDAVGGGSDESGSADESGPTDDEVIAAATALGEELSAAQTETSEFEFTSILVQCNEAVSDEIGIDYGSACGAGGSC